MGHLASSHREVMAGHLGMSHTDLGGELGLQVKEDSMYLPLTSKHIQIIVTFLQTF